MSDEIQDRIQGKRLSGEALAGTRYGDRVLLEDAHSTKQKVLCRCKCGREAKVTHGAMRSGKNQRCRTCASANRNTSHGDSRPKEHNNHRIYIIYRGFRARCNNPNAHEYERYGGRGIRVCDEWQDSYEAFREWALRNGYSDHLTLDRHPNIDGDYEPTNCRWATDVEQGRNRTNNRLICAFGETKIIAEWLEDERCIPTRETLAYRLKAGMAPELAMTKPVMKKPGRRRLDWTAISLKDEI